MFLRRFIKKITGDPNRVSRFDYIQASPQEEAVAQRLTRDPVWKKGGLRFHISHLICRKAVPLRLQGIPLLGEMSAQPAKRPPFLQKKGWRWCSPQGGHLCPGGRLKRSICREALHTCTGKAGSAFPAKQSLLYEGRPPTSSTLRILVFPGVSSGIPATTTTRSPSDTRSICFAQSTA